MTHHLKTDAVHFQAVWDRRKTAEVRFNDRDYKVGDFLCLLDGNRQRSITVEVTHILQDDTYLQPGYVVLSLDVVGLLKYDGSKR